MDVRDGYPSEKENGLDEDERASDNTERRRRETTEVGNKGTS